MSCQCDSCTLVRAEQAKTGEEAERRQAILRKKRLKKVHSKRYSLFCGDSSHDHLQRTLAEDPEALLVLIARLCGLDWIEEYLFIDHHISVEIEKPLFIKTGYPSGYADVLLTGALGQALSVEVKTDRDPKSFGEWMRQMQTHVLCRTNGGVRVTGAVLLHFSEALPSEKPGWVSPIKTYTADVIKAFKICTIADFKFVHSRVRSSFGDLN